MYDIVEKCTTKNRSLFERYVSCNHFVLFWNEIYWT